VTIAAPRDHHWTALCEAMQRPELSDDPRYVNNNERIQRADEVREIVTGWTSTRTKAAVVAVLAGQVPCGPVNTASEIVADPHVAARDMLVEFEHPGTDLTTAFAGNAIKMTGTPPSHRMRAPSLDEHQNDLLTSLDLTDAEIERLRSDGAIR
jgi:crotonobetainyl-CoA:carnitine CoA-transferase CaiB-like acyl-CoA transferase